MIPDIERELSAYLRADGAVAALVDDRVYTIVPAGPTFPLVRLTRIGGAPARPHLLYHDVAEIQLDCYADRKAEAQTLAETVREALAAMPGVHGTAVVTAVRFGRLQYLPDGTFDPARPRYIADVTIHHHP